MVRTINSKLNEANEKAQFTTTNFIEKEIKEIDSIERKNNSFNRFCCFFSALKFCFSFSHRFLI